MPEYRQVPEDSYPELGFTDLSLIEEGGVTGKKKPPNIYFGPEIIEIEDNEILSIVCTFLNCLGLYVEDPTKEKA